MPLMETEEMIHMVTDISNGSVEPPSWFNEEQRKQRVLFPTSLFWTEPASHSRCRCHSDYRFNLDWLLRSVNTAWTGEAKFSFLPP